MTVLIPALIPLKITAAEKAAVIYEEYIYDLCPYTYILEDSSSKIELEYILSNRSNEKFILNKSQEIHHDHTYSSFWYRFSVRNINKEDKPMVLVFKNPTIGRLQVFIKRTNLLIETSQTGISLPFYTRSIENKDFCYNINLPANQIVTFFCKIEPMGDALNTPILLFEDKYFYNTSVNESLIHGFFYGLLVLTVLVSIVLIFGFSSISEKMNVFLIGVLVVFILWNFNLDGLAFQYIWPYTPWLSNFCTYGLPLIGVGFLSLLSNEFFEKINRIKIILVFKIIFILIIIAFITYSLIYPQKPFYTHLISIIIGSATLVFTFISSYIQLKKDNRFIRYLIIAFIIIISWLIITILKAFSNTFNHEFYFITFKLFLGSQAIVLTIAVFTKLKHQFSQSYQKAIAQQNEIVELKTLEIEKKNRQIILINNELTQKNEQILKKNQELKYKNYLMFEDIKYAQKIQNAFLPDNSSIGMFQSEVFSFYKPKQMLSGDFYWINEIKHHLIAATFDCTGHGIQGALLSILGHDLLNTIIIERNTIQPKEILTQLHFEFHSILKYGDINENFIEGMDIGIVVIDTRTRSLSFAGARIPALIFSKGTMFECKPENFSIGNTLRKKSKEFSEQYFELAKDDMIYMYTDGFANQFNPNYIKFKNNNIKMLLSEISSLSTLMQKEELEKRFNEWKGDAEQTDEVLVIGIKM